MLTKLREWNDKRQLSELGLQLWDSLYDDEWHFERSQYSDFESSRLVLRHPKADLQVFVSFKLDALVVGKDNAAAWDYALTKQEQRILLRRLQASTNRHLAFQFKLAPFKE